MSAQAESSHEAPAEKCRLLSIPGVLRIAIFAHVVRLPRTWIPRMQPDISDKVGPMRTCRQIRQEARPLFFALNPMYIQLPALPSRWFGRLKASNYMSSIAWAASRFIGMYWRYRNHHYRCELRVENGNILWRLYDMYSCTRHPFQGWDQEMEKQMHNTTLRIPWGSDLVDAVLDIILDIFPLARYWRPGSIPDFSWLHCDCKYRRIWPLDNDEVSWTILAPFARQG